MDYTSKGVEGGVILGGQHPRVHVVILKDDRRIAFDSFKPFGGVRVSHLVEQPLMDHEGDDPAEAERIRRAAEGDHEAMEMIYNGYKTMVFAVGMAICGNGCDADDVVQETFLRVFPKLRQWRGESRFGTWLYAAALRTAQNWKSRFAARKPVPAPSLAAAVPGLETDDRTEQRERLAAAVRDLPEQQRITLMLKHIRGLSIREVAELQGCAEGTVKANLHHAIHALMRRLGGGLE